MKEKLMVDANGRIFYNGEVIGEFDVEPVEFADDGRIVLIYAEDSD